MTFTTTPGTVYFVGAGPGAPDLITVRGQAIIAAADLILYADSLVAESVAELARRPDARIVATSTMNLDQIAPLMIEAARAGGIVARVHSGDPALYGATHEQMVALERAAIPYDVVPGVPAAFAAAARLGVELTIPELSQSIILTRAAGRVSMPPGEDLRGLAAHGTSLAILLSVTRMRQVVDELLAGGAYTPETPVAVLHKVTWPDESIVLGTLADISAKVKAAGYTRHAIIMVGPALDPALKLREQQAVSHLYDKGYTHRFRRGVGPAQAAAAARGRPETAPSAPLDQSVAPVIIAVTRPGAQLAARLARELPADLAIPARFAGAPEASFTNEAFEIHIGVPARGEDASISGDEADHIIASSHPRLGSNGDGPSQSPSVYDDSALAEIRRRWSRHRALVLVMATGVAVRAIAPLLGQKSTDPAVICLDEAGRSVISLLGGHQAGANELALRIAALTGGHAAITTASDIQGKPALDRLGKAQGWRIDPASALTRASASLVNGDPVGVFVDSALPAAQREAATWSADNFVPVAILAELLSEEYAAAVIVSHRAIDETMAALLHKSVLYRPPALVAGIGCRRGVPAEELRAALDIALAEADLAPASIAALATVDLKADEPGLIELADSLGVPLRVIDRARLAALDPAQFSPSAATARFDLPGVAEPCAVLVSGGELLLPKRVFERCTAAIALSGDRGEANN
jgi:precorrin-4 C11-methyltransferase